MNELQKCQESVALNILGTILSLAFHSNFKLLGSMLNHICCFC